MDQTGPRTLRRQPSTASRRVGYAIAIVINLALWYAVAIWPGWSVLPFLTSDFTKVLPIVVASFAVTVAVNAVWLGYDARWVRAVGTLVTSVVGVAVAVQMWQVFPFEFGDSSVPWTLLVRIVLGLAVAGTLVGALVSAIQIVALAGPNGRRP